MCKKSLTTYIADEMLRLISKDRSLCPHQRLVTNIRRQAYEATNQSKQERNDLPTNADEADLRVWLHCVKAAGVCKLVYSPDTDIYHIGLTIVGELQECDVVQLSKYTDDRARYLHINKMMTVQTNDSDISEVPLEERPQVIQSIYVATGCNYTSFFNGIGKVSFLATFYQHASFITGENGPPGSIGQISLDLESDARFSFLRLIGCAYYKQHVSAFHLQTPEALYFSILNATSTYDHHAKWLTIIRTTLRQRVDMESKVMPSMELYFYTGKGAYGYWKCGTMQHKKQLIFQVCYT